MRAADAFVVCSREAHRHCASSIDICSDLATQNRIFLKESVFDELHKMRSSWKNEILEMDLIVINNILDIPSRKQR